MDDRRFDRIARALGERQGRRETMAALAGLAAAGIGFGRAAAEDAPAAEARCGKDGDNCYSKKDCCDGYKCKNGRCKSKSSGSCGREGDRCSSKSDCCSGYGCKNSRCRSKSSNCGRDKDSCDYNSDCCSGYKCKSGRCKSSGGGGCGSDNADCLRDTDCCDGYYCNPSNDRCKVDNRAVYVTQWGIKGSLDGQFDQPSGIAVDPDATGGTAVYVSDTRNSRIQKFDSEGGFKLAFGKQGSKDQQLYEPQGIRIWPRNGWVFIADTGNNRVSQWSGDGYWQRNKGEYGKGDGQFNNPRGVGIEDRSGSDGYLYVADTGNNRIQRFYADRLGYIQQWGTVGSGDGQLNAPYDVVVGRSYIYVADSSNDRIQMYSKSDYSYYGKFGTTGDGDGQFRNPRGVAWDSINRRLFVADTDNNRIQVFDETGRFIQRFGAEGTGDSRFRKPHAVAVDDYRVYVADTGNNRVQKFTVKP